MVDSDGNGLVFILSTPRAGSTLLAAMLGSHSRIICPAEPWLLLPLHAIMSPDSELIAAYDHSLARAAWRDLMDGELALRACRSFATEIYNQLAVQANKEIVVDKTPRYYHILPWLENIFPRAHKIWIQRNPLDIIASCKETWGLSVDEMTGTTVTPHTFDTTISFALLASFFSETTAPRYKIRYEDLVQTPVDQLQALCAYLGLSFEQAMLDYGANGSLMNGYAQAKMGDKKILAHQRPHGQSIGRWQEILSPVEIKQILLTLGSDVFLRQGYGDVLNQAAALAGLAEADLDERGQLDQVMTLYSAYAVEGLASPEASQYSHLARENAQLRGRLTECETDRSERLVVIASQGQTLGEVEAERNSLRFQLNDLLPRYEAAEADRAARLRVIEEQGQRLGVLEAEANELRGKLDNAQQQADSSNARLQTHEQSFQSLQHARIYRILRRLGLWN